MPATIHFSRLVLVDVVRAVAAVDGVFAQRVQHLDLDLIYHWHRRQFADLVAALWSLRRKMTIDPKPVSEMGGLTCMVHQNALTFRSACDFALDEYENAVHCPGHSGLSD